jgi:polysaccharide export outer membrane protein
MIEANGLGPSRRMANRSVVGPDGTVEIGPYGHVLVAGLTPDQAKAAIARHLAPFLARPVVAVRLVDGQTDANVAWRAAARPAPAQQGSGGASTWRPVPRRPQTVPPVVVTAGWHSRSSGKDSGEVIAAVSSSTPAIRVSTDNEPKPADPQLLHPPRLEPAPQAPLPAEAVPLAHGPIGPGGPVPPPIPRELNKVPLPPYRIEPPDILLVEVLPVGGKLKFDQPISGQHLVRPDGTIGLGIYGSVYVAGMTLEEARTAITQYLVSQDNNIKRDSVNVDVLAYNSKFYYVVTDGAGFGEQVIRIPITGNETVLDAISLINGLPPVASKKHIWLARRNPGHGSFDAIYPVDWCGVTQRGGAATNYQIMPGDRVYVKADKWRTFDATVGKVLAPFERMLGATLLGSETVNSIRNRSTTGTGTAGR